MPTSSDLVMNLSAEIKFHDPFPRADYVSVCVRDGREATEEGYEQWRDTCERLSGDMSTERRIGKLGEKLSGAFAELGVSASQASTAIGALAVALGKTNKIAKIEDEQ